MFDVGTLWASLKRKNECNILGKIWISGNVKKKVEENCKSEDEKPLGKVGPN